MNYSREKTYCFVVFKKRYASQYWHLNIYCVIYSIPVLPTRANIGCLLPLGRLFCVCICLSHGISAGMDTLNMSIWVTVGGGGEAAMANNYWSERSACAALRRCSETKCPLYLVLFFFLSFSVPHTFLPEGFIVGFRNFAWGFKSQKK